MISGPVFIFILLHSVIDMFPYGDVHVLLEGMWGGPGEEVSSYGEEVVRVSVVVGNGNGDCGERWLLLWWVVFEESVCHVFFGDFPPAIYVVYGCVDDFVVVMYGYVVVYHRMVIVGVGFVVVVIVVLRDGWGRKCRC